MHFSDRCAPIAGLVVHHRHLLGQFSGSIRRVNLDQSLSLYLFYSKDLPSHKTASDFILHISSKHEHCDRRDSMVSPSQWPRNHSSIMLKWHIPCDLVGVELSISKNAVRHPLSRFQGDSILSRPQFKDLNGLEISCQFSAFSRTTYNPKNC